MLKRPTSTPEMATDNSISGRIHKRTPSNPGYNLVTTRSFTN